MTKQQENRAFAKMLKEFPKAFGRVSFRERLMLRTAFSYVVEEVIADIKANFDYVLEGKDLEIKTLGERCNQLLKDKGELTDQIADIKANCDLAIEGRDVKIMELGKENKRLKGDLELYESGGCRATNLFKCGVVKELKEQMEKMKCCGNCKHFDKLYNRCELTRLTLKGCLCNALDKWELRR